MTISIRGYTNEQTRVLLLSLLWILIPYSLRAVALVVHPGELFMKPSKPGYYYVQNQSDRALAVVVEAQQWLLDEEGREENPAAEELLVYPKHFILKGKQKRKIKVSRRGPAPQVESAYRVLIRELPVQLDNREQVSGVYMAIAYKTACYIGPKNVQSDIRIDEATLDGSRLTLLLHNVGTRHQHLGNVRVLLLDGRGREVAVDRESVVTVMEKQNIHAKKRRRFQLELPDSLPLMDPKSLIVTYDKEDGRTYKQEASLRIL